MESSQKMTDIQMTDNHQNSTNDVSSWTKPTPMSPSAASASFIPPGLLSPTSYQSMKSPPDSPSKPRYSDRFIPARNGNLWNSTYWQMPPLAGTPETNNSTPPKKTDPNSAHRRPGSIAYKSLLENEVLGYYQQENSANNNMKPSTSTAETGAKKSARRKLFHYDSNERSSVAVTGPMSQYLTSPISPKSENILRVGTTSANRFIAPTPYKVLDAPNLEDDFYLHLLDWSAQNLLCVGLGRNVFGKACGGEGDVCQLFDSAEYGDSVTSVAFNGKGNQLAVGTSDGIVHQCDVATRKKLSAYLRHKDRVGSIAWNGDLIATGSKDRLVYVRDDREPPRIEEKRFEGHRQEICGLKWSPDAVSLASGGNDNKLNIWDIRNSNQPVQQYLHHTAAVKAIAWSPHHRGILVTGAGTGDKNIRVWNTLLGSGAPLDVVDTGSQVCNIAWSKHTSELVSTHGYPSNTVIVWKYSSFQQLAKLTGHTSRVVYMAMSPGGEDILTGSSDETLRLWKVFVKPKLFANREGKSLLDMYSNIR